MSWNFQMGDKDNPNDIDADAVDQLISKQQQQQQRLQSKVLPKEQQTMSVVDDIQLPKLVQSDVLQSQSQSQPNKAVADVFYPEPNLVNVSDSQSNTEEHELETRLK